MSYEQVANLYSSTLAANYTAGSGVISVASGAGLPSGGVFALTIIDQSTLSVKVILRGFFLGGTAIAVTAEGSDSSAVTGDFVVGTMLTVRSLGQLFNDRELFGLLANRPSSGLFLGDRYVASDGLPDFYHYEASGSPATNAWQAYIGALPVTPPKIADFATSVVGANATRTVWKDQGAASGGVVLAATSSNAATDNLVLQVKAIPTAPYTVTVRFVVTGAPLGHFEWGGVCLRESSSGKFETFGVAYRAALELRDAYWTNPTTFSTSKYEEAFWAAHQRSGWYHFQISDDSTNRIRRVSADGVNWVQVVSTVRTDFMTPDQIGFFLSPYDNTSQISVVDFTVS